MKKAMAFVLALALFACAPMTAFAADTGRDTQTEEVEVAATGANSSTAAKASSSAKASTPATGDDTSPFVPACLVLGASALVTAGVAAKRARSADE